MNTVHGDKGKLTLRQAFREDAGAKSSMLALLGAVFDRRLPTWARMATTWTPLAFFDETGRCIACLEVDRLPILLDDQHALATAIRSVAVHPYWRGRGLFRELMREAIDWCERQTRGPILLYSAEPKLYERFGFRLVPQHAFSGPASVVGESTPARMISLEDPDERSLVLRLLETRTPVSRQCAVLVGTSLFVENAAVADDLLIAYSAEHDAVIAYEIEDDAIVLVDVVAAAIPSMAIILAAIEKQPTRVTTNFPPDRLNWHGEPVPDDTGLMVRGALPPAMTRPFMLPPTTEF